MNFWRRRFNLKKCIRDVFSPHQGEQVLIITDLPQGDQAYTQDWKDRHSLAVKWEQGFKDLGLTTSPTLEFKAAGHPNAELPMTGTQLGVEVPIEDVLSEHAIVLAITQYDATAPLTMIAQRYPRIRIATMHGLESRMEETSLMVDYNRLSKKTAFVKDLLDRTNGARVNFTTGQEMYFDLRFRKAFSDDGQVQPTHPKETVKSLPSGAAIMNPYEGEREDFESQTIGILPVYLDGQIAQFFIEANKITRVIGGGKAVDEMNAWFEADEARRNLSLFGLGCNERSRVIGRKIEDQKAGFFCGYGRSDFVGGHVGLNQFKNPTGEVYGDLIFSRGAPIHAYKIMLTLNDQTNKTIMEKGQYTIFSGK
ncbi:MAG: hypothetical protein ACI9TH_000177 [Kiritimatiellia bacterium]|jgi:hypothetical protein